MGAIHTHNIVWLGILFVGVLTLAIMATLAPRTTAHASACSVYSSAYNVPEGYGAAFNVWSSARELLLQAHCTESGFSARAGSSLTGAQDFAVLKTGYYFDGNSWKPFDWVAEDGSETTSNDYIVGPARSATVLGYRGEYTYWTSFTCVQYLDIWRCGCRDTNCYANYWNLQVVQRSTL